MDSVLGKFRSGSKEITDRKNVELCNNSQAKPFSPAFGNTLLLAGINAL